jgi:hypothetical protein
MYQAFPFCDSRRYAISDLVLYFKQNQGDHFSFVVVHLFTLEITNTSNSFDPKSLPRKTFSGTVTLATLEM